MNAVCTIKNLLGIKFKSKNDFLKMIYSLHKDKKSIYQVCLISIAEFIHAFVKPAEQQSKTSEFYCTKILYSIRNVKDRLHNKLHYKKK